MKTKFALAAVLLAAACGGGKSDIDAQLSRTDARNQIDAPVVPAGCDLETTINEPPNPDPTAGNTAVLRTQDSMSNEIILWNYVVTGTGANADLFQFVVPFDAAAPNVPAADFNTPLDLVNACTSSVDYCLVGLGDFDFNAGMEDQFFYPNTGQLTITAAGDVGGNFTVEMTDSRFDRYTDAGGDIVDENGDGTPDCSGTVSAFAPVTIPITAPAVAPHPGDEYYGKFGKYTRH